MAKKNRKRKRGGPASTSLEAEYVCDSCGETIVIPIDVAAGSEQNYVEDCPVCCAPNVVHLNDLA